MKMIKTVLPILASACVGPVVVGMSIEEWCQTLRDQEAAIRRGDWQQAAVYSAKASAGDTVTGFIPVNYVNNCLVGVLCDWNFEGIEKRSENCKVLQALREQDRQGLRSPPCRVPEKDEGGRVGRHQVHDQ